MSNRMFKPGKKKLLEGDIAFDTDTIKVALIDVADYTFDQTHEFLTSASAGIVGTPQTLGSKTFTDGVFDAADATFPTVTGDPCEAAIIYKDTGSAATSPLLFYIDTATGLPVTPNGGNITVQWHSSGIAALTDV